MKRTVLLLSLVALSLGGLTACDVFVETLGQAKTFTIDGQAMQPNFEPGETVWCVEITASDQLRRGDVVIFHYPDDPRRDFIKRIIGLPGETVTIMAGQVYIDGWLLIETYIEYPYNERVCTSDRSQRNCSWEIGPDEYFVLGDNRNASKDSQDFGPVARELMVCRVTIHPVIYEPGPPMPTPLPTLDVTPTPSPNGSVPYGNYR